MSVTTVPIIPSTGQTVRLFVVTANIMRTRRDATANKKKVDIFDLHRLIQ